MLQIITYCDHEFFYDGKALSHKTRRDMKAKQTRDEWRVIIGGRGHAKAKSKESAMDIIIREIG